MDPSTSSSVTSTIATPRKRWPFGRSGSQNESHTVRIIPPAIHVSKLLKSKSPSHPCVSMLQGSYDLLSFVLSALPQLRRNNSLEKSVPDDGLYPRIVISFSTSSHSRDKLQYAKQ